MDTNIKKKLNSATWFIEIYVVKKNIPIPIVEKIICLNSKLERLNSRLSIEVYKVNHDITLNKIN